MSVPRSRQRGGKPRSSPYARTVHPPTVEEDPVPTDIDEAARLDFLEAIVRDNGDMIAVIDDMGRFTFVSEAARRTLGHAPEDLVGRDGFEIIHPDDLGLAAESLVSTVAGGPGVREPLLLRLRQADGAWREVEILTNNLSSDGRVAGLVVTARDMAARRQSEATAKEARDLFEQAFDRAPIGMVLVEVDGVIRRANAALARMLGMPVQELVGCNIVRLAHPDDRRGAARHAMASLSGEDQPALELRFVRPDGTLAWARATSTIVRGEDASPLYGVVQVEDVTEQQVLRAELQRAATHDPLTGVLNRAGLALHYDRYMRTSRQPSAFVLIDLDGFKPVNDRYGHHAGDQLLVYVAGRLRRTIRGDATIGRIGGDEFVAHIGGVADPEQAMAIGDRVRRTISAPFVVEGHKVQVSGSIGVGFLRGPTNLEDALLASDRASYRAKHAGGNRVELADVVPPAVRRRDPADGTSTSGTSTSGTSTSAPG